jgi:hypothetical protein
VKDLPLLAFFLKIAARVLKDTVELGLIDHTERGGRVEHCNGQLRSHS